ncbi:MAG: CCA tRNA nucleotidyltransferase [Paracoccus denitrificans]|nr:MAG: CCA tRNA nucleotidyltransferase [Paracoccus denitrificans]PZO85149.1 MAG: CCA tRNA nucleotidyltransferase [Paracoccus denitrificans]
MTPTMPAAMMADPDLQAVLSALVPHRALLVGGAVRNALMGLPAHDIDIATDARPEEVVAAAKTAGLKTVPTGIDHGTVTVIVHGRPFEVTTFRRDVETDGRRAVVAFSDRIEDDAERRDFTMNALYADAEGRIIDPVGGLPDLAARRLRFVGDPDARIVEDYLRILRFFRFYAHYAQPGTADGAALAACAHNAPGLAGISHERIGAEMRKLLAAPDPTEAVQLMDQTGVLSQLLGAANAGRLAALIGVEDQFLAPDALRWPVRLAALQAGDAANRLRLSKQEARDQVELASDLPLHEIAYRFGPRVARGVAALRATDGKTIRPDWRDAIAAAVDATFPISAADVMPQLTGAQVGRGLRAAETAWIADEFVLPAPALIDIALTFGSED